MDKGKTETLLLKGTLDSLENEIKLNKTSIIKEKHNIYLNNTSNESIIVYNEKIIPIFEVYGNNLHKTPQVSIYSRDLDLISKINFPNIEYRITDVTAPDDSGKFWAINYFYPGDNEKLKPARDLIFSEFGIGATHRIYDPVERLVQFQILENKIIISPKAPIYIKLLGNESRNWEGIAKFDDKGFIIATDTFPETILAFIRINNG
jgi:hypothetical protein